MSTYGFVYILTNPRMTCFKLGCTERSPHERADELSKPTGVPCSFEVACYIEVPNFQTIERAMHKSLAPYRVSMSREFFDDAGLSWALRLMRWHPERMAFTLVDPELPDRYDFEDAESDPWRQPEPEEGEPVAANDEAAKPARAVGFE